MLERRIRSDQVPKHVAIIMDGNGRWAAARGLPRVEGHRRGAESVRAVLRCASRLGIRHLTLYAFSVENWNRPKAEVDTLMTFLARYLKTEQAEMDQNNVRLRAIGQLDRLPGFVREQLDATIASLDPNSGTTLHLARRSLCYRLPSRAAALVGFSRGMANTIAQGTMKGGASASDGWSLGTSLEASLSNCPQSLMADRIAYS